MNLSTGQITFALIFVVVFFVALIILYQKDKNVRKTHYSGLYWLLAIIVGVIFSYFVIVKILSN